MLLDTIICSLCGKSADVGYSSNDPIPSICGECQQAKDDAIQATLVQTLKNKLESEVQGLTLEQRMERLELNLALLGERLGEVSARASSPHDWIFG